MNKDLSAVSTVIISHGHYDHAGGLLPLLQELGSRVVFAHPGAFDSRFRVKDTGECISIGIPYTREVLETAGAVFNLSTEFREIAPSIFLTGEVPRLTPFETGDQGLFRNCSGKERDITPDDQSLVLVTDKGLVIVLGCCHAGLINTMDHVAERLGRRDLYAVIGGTHLGFCSAEQLDQTMAVLKKSGICKLAPSHCTGFAASARLSRDLPKAFQLASVGYTLEV
jgi:7,8-dihydropterin-6-yl-methyl-4-(beta-D-ribofuranosyl)aminobenzene 5'-phosphate synthase